MAAASAAVLTAVVLVAGLVVRDPPRKLIAKPLIAEQTATPTDARAERAERASQLRARSPAVTMAVDGTYSWAMLNRITGARYGSANSTQVNFTESMVKPWLVADFLRRAAAQKQKPPQYRMSQLVRAIRDSSDGAAESIWIANGRDSSIRRMAQICNLPHTRVFPGMWSQTWMSTQEAVRLGECIVNGTAAGPQWTSWVLNEMRHVRGTTVQQPYGGRWGIIDAIPSAYAPTVAIKNGWTLHSDRSWHVNCLGIHDDWILAIMTIYPGEHGLDYGARLCETITRQVLQLDG